MDGQVLEEIEVFKYLGLLVQAEGGVKADAQQRVSDGSKVMGYRKTAIVGLYLFLSAI